MKSYTHYIFDLDQTLVTLHIDWSHWHSRIVEIFAKRGIPYTYTSSMDSCMRLNDLVRREGESARAHISAMVRESELSHLHGYTPVHRVIHYLQSLPSDTHKYIWTANSLDTATKALEDNHLSRYFESIAARDNVSYSKPDPAGFIEMIYDGETPLSQYVMIGDSTNDAAAARAAGIDYIHVDELRDEDLAI